MTFDFAKLCEDVRDTTLEVSADCVELFARTKAVASGSEPSCDPRGRRGDSDFLYDLVHLNVGYWMQLARLGSAYSVYAHRAMAALYGAYATPYGSSEPPCELLFEGAPDNTQTRFVLVTNRTEQDQELTIGLSKLHSNDEVIEPKVRLCRGAADAKGTVIGAHETARIGIEMTIPKKPSGSYRGTVSLTLGGRTATYPVTLRIQ